MDEPLVEFELTAWVDGTLVHRTSSSLVEVIEQSIPQALKDAAHGAAKSKYMRHHPQDWDNLAKQRRLEEE